MWERVGRRRGGGRVRRLVGRLRVARGRVALLRIRLRLGMRWGLRLGLGLGLGLLDRQRGALDLRRERRTGQRVLRNR